MSNQKGFTLGEVLSATAVAGVSLLILMALFNMIGGHFVEIRERMEAEEQATNAEFYLRSTISQAVDLISTNAAIPANIALGASGRIRTVNYNTLAAAPAGFVTLALFNRDGAGFTTAAGVANQHGGLKQTAIWYKGPDITVLPPTWGTLMFNLGSNLAGGWAAPVAPNTAGPTQFIDRVSGIRITTNDSINFATRVLSVEITMSFRYHLNPRYGVTWCPVANLKPGPPTAGCVAATTNPQYVDLQRTFTILARNNLMKIGASPTSGVTSEERTLGNLFFFNPILPVN